LPDEISKLYNSLPAWVQQSPAIVLLLAVIIGLLTGYIYTGRTFDREVSRCQTEAVIYKTREDQILKDLIDSVKANSGELRGLRRERK
jgi:hypothetical protein